MASRSIAGQLVRLLHGLATPVCVFDEDRRLIFVNEACARWTGVPLDELIGKPPASPMRQRDLGMP